jgi:hypothetical protein
MSPEELQAALDAKGIDFDLTDMIKKMSEEEAARLLAQQLAANQAEQEMLRKMMRKKGLSKSKRDAMQSRLNALSEEENAYKSMLQSLMDGQKKLFDEMTDAERKAQEDLLAKLARRNRRKKNALQEAAEEDDALPFSKTKKVTSETADQLKEIAGAALGLDAKQVADMSPEELQAALDAKGIDFDLTGMIKKMSEEEAARLLAQQLASNQAEQEMLRKMMRKKGLSKSKRDAMHSRLNELSEEENMYKGMLQSLMDGQKKLFDEMTDAERRAQEDLLARLARKNRRKKRAQQEAEDDDDSVPFSKTKKVSSETADQVKEIAGTMLGLSADQVAQMSAEELQAALDAKGIDFSLADMIKKMSEEEAARLLAQQLAANQAEREMLAKMMRKKGLSKSKRDAMQARLNELAEQDNAYKSMLQSLLDGQKKLFDEMTDAERKAQEDLLARLARKNRRKKRANQGAAEVEASLHTDDVNSDKVLED